MIKYNLIAAVTVTALMTTSPTAAKKKPREAWSVTKTEDSITGAKTCVVAAYDQVRKSRFTQTGALYPIVEKNDTLGILVGVSSGGRYRLPTGDILWRVDKLPHRTLKAADNPATASSLDASTPYKTGNEVADKAMADAMAATSGMTAAMTATSTVASGGKASEMLAEMLSGHGLIFRSAAVAPAFGLPNDRSSRVGQYTDEGLKPIPLDASFRAGVTECGIKLPSDHMPARTDD